MLTHLPQDTAQHIAQDIAQDTPQERADRDDASYISDTQSGVEQVEADPIRARRLAGISYLFNSARTAVFELADHLTNAQRSLLVMAGAEEALRLHQADFVATCFAEPSLCIAPHRPGQPQTFDRGLLSWGLIACVSPTEAALTPLGREVVCYLLGYYTMMALADAYGYYDVTI